MSLGIVYCSREDHQRRPSLANAADGAEIGAPGRPRTLIIEDEFFAAWHLQTMLREANFECCEIASDADSGIKLALNYDPELVLADVNLGNGPDGVEAVRRIREYCSPMVIFITAYTDEANLKRIRSLVPEARVLSKPIDPDLLIATIQSLFPRR